VEENAVKVDGVTSSDSFLVQAVFAHPYQLRIEKGDASGPAFTVAKIIN